MIDFMCMYIYIYVHGHRHNYRKKSSLSNAQLLTMISYSCNKMENKKLVGAICKFVIGFYSSLFLAYLVENRENPDLDSFL